MKKKGFGLRRAVSMLLAVAMILTAAPQTGMTALAVGGDTDASQGIAADTDTTPASYEDGNDNGTNDAVTDQAGDEDDKKEGDIEDDDSSDQPEGEGDDQPTDSGDGDQGGDDADQGEGNNTEEPAEPGEGTDDDLLTEDESVSVNDVDALGADKPMAVDEDEPEYIGNGGSFSVWHDGPWWGGIDPSFDNLTPEIEEKFEQAVEKALAYNKEQGHKFNHISFSFWENGTVDQGVTIKKDYFNAAVAIMRDPFYAGDDRVITYDVTFKDDELITYYLWCPTEMDDDLTVKYKVELLKNQGLKINIDKAPEDFPIEKDNEVAHVYVHWCINRSAGKYASDENGIRLEDYLRNDNPLASTLRVISLDESGKPDGGIVNMNNEMQIHNWHFRSGRSDVDGPSFGFNLNEAFNSYVDEGTPMKAGKDHLVTYLYGGETVLSNKEMTLRKGWDWGYWDPERPISDVSWVNLSSDIIDLVPVEAEDGGVSSSAVLTVKAAGDAYYWVTYKHNDATCSEFHLIRAVAVLDDGTELTYTGEIIDDEFRDEDESYEGNWNGVPYLRLRISEQDAKENGADINDILAYYAQRIDEGKQQKFNCIQFDMIDSNSRTVKKAYINGSLGLMEKITRDRVDDNIRDCWIDYNFWNDTTETGVNFSLSSPSTATADVKATFTLTELANQGVKVKFASTAFPAESVSMDYNRQGEKYTGSIPFSNDEFRLFKYSSNTPTAIVETSQEQGYGWYGLEEDRTNLHFNNIKPLGTTEYLITSVYKNDERPVVGETGENNQILAGARVGDNFKASELTAVNGFSSVSWKVLDANQAALDKNGILTPWNQDDWIYYYVKYQYNNATYLEVHEAHSIAQTARIELDEKEIKMEYYPSDDSDANQYYPQIRYYPVDADRSRERLEWTISEEHPAAVNGHVVEVVKDEQGVPEGGIKAVGEGTAKLTISYLDEEDGEGGYKSSGAVDPIVCQITVIQPLDWKQDIEPILDPLHGKPYAVIGVDMTLKDVEIPQVSEVEDTLGGHWEWTYPDTPLASYKGMGENQFAITYVKDDDHKFLTSVNVRIVTPTGIIMTRKNDDDPKKEEDPEWFEGVLGALENNDSMTLGYQYEFDSVSKYGDETEQKQYEEAVEKLKNIYRIDWFANPADAITSAENEGADCRKFTAKITGNGTKTEKKTVTVSAIDNVSGKAAFKDTKNITVTNKGMYNYDNVDVFWNKEDNQDYLHVKIWGVSEDDYTAKNSTEKLTIASEDTKVLKLGTATITGDEQVRGDDGEPQAVTEVKYLCTINPGSVWIKVTSQDEMKSFRRYLIEIPDMEPKAVSPTTISINKAKKTDGRYATVQVRTNAKYPLDIASDSEDNDSTSNIAFMVNGEESDSLIVHVKSDEPVTIGDNVYNIYNITVKMPDLNKASGLKSKNNKVSLKIGVKPEAEDAEEEQPSVKPFDWNLDLTLNVTDTIPKVTFKQTKKVNLFYKYGVDNEDKGYNEGYGVLNVNTNGEEIPKLALADNKSKNTACDFEIKEYEGEYYIALKNSGNPKNNKGLLTYEIDGYEVPQSVAFTVSTENKKPTIVLSSKAETLYTLAGQTDFWLNLTDKATGDALKLDSDKGDTVQYVVSKTEKSPINILGDIDWNDHKGEKDITIKNTYKVAMLKDGTLVTRLQEPSNGGKYITKADKFTMEIQKSNWTEPVSISYSVTVNISAPKLALSTSTLTLNKSDDENLYRAQQARTTLRLKNCAEPLTNDNFWVNIEGQDDKARRVLSITGSLVLEYWGEEDDNGEIVVKFNNNKIDKGSYKFKVSVGKNDEPTLASTTFTVKIVESQMTKNLKVTAKGNINVMDREGTSIAYTPKLSNLAGTVVWGRVEGEHRDFFCTDDDGWMTDGKLIVRAQNGMPFSTKETYRVTLVFGVQVEYGEQYEVSKDVIIKVKQGKPTLKATMANNVIYRQLDNDVEINLNAVFNKKPVEIERVELVNYDRDFNRPDFEYDEDTGIGTVTLSLQSRYEADSIIKSGTYKVKLRIIYRERARNEKAAEVTCSIVVK